MHLCGSRTALLAFSVRSLLAMDLSAQHRPRLSPQITWKHCSKSHVVFCMPGNFGCVIEIHPALYCAPATRHRQIYLHVLFFAHLQTIIHFKYFSAVCLLCVLANPKIRGLVCPLHCSMSLVGLLNTCRFPDRGGCSDCYNSYSSWVAA